MAVNRYALEGLRNASRQQEDIARDMLRIATNRQRATLVPPGTPGYEEAQTTLKRTMAQDAAMAQSEADQAEEAKKWERIAGKIQEWGVDPAQVEKNIPGFREHIVNRPLIPPKDASGYDANPGPGRAMAEAFIKERRRQDKEKWWDQTYRGGLTGPAKFGPISRPPHKAGFGLGDAFFGALQLKELEAVREGKNLKVDIAGKGPGTGTGLGSWSYQDMGTGKIYRPAFGDPTPPGLMSSADRNKYYAENPIEAVAGAQAVENYKRSSNPSSGPLPENTARKAIDGLRNAYPDVYDRFRKSEFSKSPAYGSKFYGV